MVKVNYKNMNRLELLDNLKKMLKEKYDLRNQLKIGKLGNSSSVNNIRKNIARVKTELNNK